MTTDSQRLHAMVHGKVQGVSFRWFVVHSSENLGLVGWTRNGADGRSVEVVAEGQRTLLEDLLGQLHTGPPRARVDRVETAWESPTGEFDGFTTRYG